MGVNSDVAYEVTITNPFLLSSSTANGIPIYCNYCVQNKLLYHTHSAVISSTSREEGNWSVGTAGITASSVY